MTILNLISHTTSKKPILLLLFAFCSVLCRAQIPAIDWQKCFGGPDEEFATSIQQTKDSGYIIAGSGQASGGDVTGNHGSNDYWIVKLTANGSLRWQKSLGSLYENDAFAIRQTTDGGYIVAGNSGGLGGDVNCNHGGKDIWLVKLSATGSIVWQKCLGGSADDEVRDVQLTSDNGFILVGASYSSNGDVTGNQGGSDYWIVKLTSSGSIQWQKNYGGSDNDFAGSVKQTFDGGYIVAGATLSYDGTVGATHGDFDIWILKLTSTGSITWKRIFGGTGEESVGNILQTPDSGFIFAGTTSTIADGDIAGGHGTYDNWIVKLSPSGLKEWQKCLGGTDQDYCYTIAPGATPGTYVTIGTSRSNDGDVSGNHGDFDSWITKITSEGTIKWQKTYGGSANDAGVDIKSTFDGGYVILSYTSSTGGDVTSPNHGYNDYWVVKLMPDPALSMNDPVVSPVVSIAPNPTTRIVNINGISGACVKIYNTVGILVQETPMCNNFSVSQLATGIYFVRLYNEQKELVYQDKLVKQ